MSRREIQKLYLDELGITEADEIDLEAIAYYKGATVEHRQLDGCEARIIGYGEKAIITVNDSSPLFRQNFSIGHELGHWFRHRGTIGNLCQATDVKSNRFSQRKAVPMREKVANDYAAELLMPHYLFSRHIAGSDVSFDVIRSVKNIFNVSLTAAAIKYVGSCGFPVLLVSYKSGRRGWYHRSTEVPEHFYPVRELDRNSAAYRTLIGKPDSGSTLCDADIWIDAQGSEDYEIREVSWKVSDDEVMVFLWWENESHIIDHSTY